MPVLAREPLYEFQRGRSHASTRRWTAESGKLEMADAEKWVEAIR